MADPVTPTMDQARDAGADSIKSGVNQGNCHFSFFATPALRDAWEEGQKQAQESAQRKP